MSSCVKNRIRLGYWTHNQKETIDPCGTSLVGQVNVAFSRLVELFGLPLEGSDDGKTDAEWIVEFYDGSVATVYNYKDGKGHLGADGLATESIRIWHIGGFESEVADRVYDLIASA